MYRYRFWLIGGALPALVLGVSLFFLLQPAWPAPELVDAKKAVSYPIYYPAQLPSGYSYKKDSAKPSSTVVIYTLVSGSKQIHVSIEPKPAGVQFDDFYNRVLTGKADVVSGEGKAVIGTTNNQLVGSLVTDKVWVVVNAPDGLDAMVMQTLVQQLKKL